jgi:hypothetical protein
MRRYAILLTLVLLAPLAAWACTIPVFRYALERWELSTYDVIVFHEQALPQDVDALLSQLDTGKIKANVKVTRVPIGQPMPPAFQKLWQRQDAKKSLPWLVVRLQDVPATQADAWAGPLTAPALRQLLDSPARQKVVEHLGRGSSAIFVLLQSGNDEADKAAAKLLDDELTQAAKRVQLPEQDPNGPQLLTAIPLRVEFTTLTLDRRAAAEQGLVSLLLSTDDEVAKAKGPIVLPIFGRGRVLCSLFGDDLRPEALRSVVQFLCGKCSCDVKELNPGTDLLMTADWPAVLERAGAKAPATIQETLKKSKGK